MVSAFVSNKPLRSKEICESYSFKDLLSLFGLAMTGSISYELIAIFESSNNIELKNQHIRNMLMFLALRECTLSKSV